MLPWTCLLISDINDSKEAIESECGMFFNKSSVQIENKICVCGRKWRHFEPSKEFVDVSPSQNELKINEILETLMKKENEVM